MAASQVSEKKLEAVVAEKSEVRHPSRITDIDVFELDIPFNAGGGKEFFTFKQWNSFDSVLVKIATADGAYGWGECFAYGCREAVAEAFKRMVAPQLLGEDADDVPALMEKIQRKLHIFGRYGITMFAISGADIALWDRKARAQSIPLWQQFGELHRQEIPAYASLVHYGDPSIVRRVVAEARDLGYVSIKLHETTAEAVLAGREAAGPDTELTVDANCSWNLDEAREFLHQVAGAEITWIEEPIFPPEDFLALHELTDSAEVPVAAGENFCTRYQFDSALRSGALNHPQPSVTKVGGITEFRAVIDRANQQGLISMPHSPYFGPGYWATIHLLAGSRGPAKLEYNFVQPDAQPGLNTPTPHQGFIEVPAASGMGFEPDPEVFEKFAASNQARLTFTSEGE